MVEFGATGVPLDYSEVLGAIQIGCWSGHAHPSW
jgi:hypothetical protein